MSKSIASTPDPYGSPSDGARSGVVQPIPATRRFKPQTQWKGILDAAAPLSPAEWLDREISRFAAATTTWASAAQTITEALRIAGDQSNPYAVAAAAEYLSVVRLPDRPRRNADLSAVPAAGGVS